MTTCDELRVKTVGSVGHIHLHRPEALNALTIDMIVAMKAAMESWYDDPAIHVVLLTGEGDEAFCAGGDVKAIYYEGLKGNLNKDGYITSDFFREEYKLNALIASYPKPMVSIWDGIVLGGGVGVSIMGSHRIGSEKLKFGMPETAIGFFPDVGGTYFMTKMGPIGTLLSLTGQTIGAGDSFAIGAATDYIPSSKIGEFVSDLSAIGLDQALEKHGETPPAPKQFAELSDIAERHFQKNTAEEIYASLEQDESELAGRVLKTLNKRSPAAMKVTLRQFQEGKNLSFEACLDMEFRICQHSLNEHDFYEGIRSVLVDKDRNPSWRPERLENVSADYVNKHFLGLNERELGLS